MAKPITVPARDIWNCARTTALKLERDSAVTYDPETELLITHRGNPSLLPRHAIDPKSRR